LQDRDEIAVGREEDVLFDIGLLPTGIGNVERHANVGQWFWILATG
jgi:hypothetical protein